MGRAKLNSHVKLNSYLRGIYFKVKQFIILLTFVKERINKYLLHLRIDGKLNLKEIATMGNLKQLRDLGGY